MRRCRILLDRGATAAGLVERTLAEAWGEDGGALAVARPSGDF